MGILLNRLLLACCFLAPVYARAAAEIPPPDAAPGSERADPLSAAPDFTAKGIDGRTYHLHDLIREGPVLVEFWTTACKPCMMELPRLQKVWEKHRDRGFTFLGVVSDDQKTSARAKPTILSKGFKFPNVLDPDHRIGALYNVRNYPTSVLINREGKIVTYVLGMKKGFEEEVDRKVSALLAGGGQGRAGE